MSYNTKMRASLERINDFANKHFKSPSTTDSMLSSEEVTFGASLYRTGVVPMNHHHPVNTPILMSPQKKSPNRMFYPESASRTFQSPDTISRHKKAASEIPKVPLYCGNEVFEENTELYHTLIKNSAKRKRDFAKLAETSSPKNNYKHLKGSGYNPVKNLSKVFEEFNRKKHDPVKCVRHDGKNKSNHGYELYSSDTEDLQNNEYMDYDQLKYQLFRKDEEIVILQSKLTNFEEIKEELKEKDKIIKRLQSQMDETDERFKLQEFKFKEVQNNLMLEYEEKLKSLESTSTSEISALK